MKTGRYIVTNSSGESVQAFVPNPLPPKPPITMDSKLNQLLKEASSSIEKLELASKLVPSREWLLYGFIRKEAVITSQIEGTQSTLIDLLSVDENQNEDKDLEEVCNYIRALDYAWDQVNSKEGLPLSLRLIKETHKRLMKGTRGKTKNPGEFRTTQNWIGGTRPGTAAFVPPPPKEMMGCLDQFEKYLHADSSIDPLINIAYIHVHFETIHPFLDGNGRIGRLLIALLLRVYGILNSPLLYLSLYFKKNRQQYYELLNKVRTEGAWLEWVNFFLEGVNFVSKDVIEASEKLQKLSNKNREKLLKNPKATVASLRLLEELPKKPIISISQAVDILELTKPPVTKAINLLIEAKILTETTGKKKDRLYRYKDYLDILAEGTEL